jgi:hypothetical protein
VSGKPPVSVGAVQLTKASLSPGVALTFVGGPGTGPVGTTAFDGADGGPVPWLLVAVTVKVYEVPIESGLTTAELVVPFVVAVTFPGFEVTV